MYVLNLGKYQISCQVREFCVHIYFRNRLILAMDPKHGEISRAMRNRGVEIYMLGEVSPAAHYACVTTTVQYPTLSLIYQDCMVLKS